MAVDGSFRVEYELKRFVRRCPKVADIPQVDSLLKKGSTLTEKEVVHEVAELLLHPNYTIPLVGCFRPLARKIINRAVDLLRLVPSLRSISDDSMIESVEDNVMDEDENLDSPEALHIIDFYGRRGKGLSLHELACLAFSRALDLVPAVLGSVLCYFKFAPPPFARVKQRASTAEPLAMAGIDLLNAVRVSYRLLLADPEVFSTLWDWSCFLILVQQPSDLNQGDVKSLMIVSDIRWCSIQILSVNLKISERTTTDSGLDDKEAFSCLLRWQEFLKDISLEKAGWYLESFEENRSNSFSKDGDFSQGQGLSSLSISSLKFDETESSILTSMETSRDRASTALPFVLTSGMKKSFEMVLLAVSQRWPVLLYGPAGSGKTALISRLASVYRRRVLSIHMDDQIDGKTLIGNYVCTEQPGEFRWQPGSLTQAVLNGFWVVFEDIDKAPADVQSILLPLLEGAGSFQTGHGEAVRIAEGFRLFSTVSSSRLDAVRATEGQNSLGAFWRRVMVRPSSTEDLQKIVKAWHPDLELLSKKLIETFQRVNQLVGFHFGTSGRFSTRDLLKWCKRIDGQGFHFDGDRRSSYECNSIYLEAVDIFAASSSLPGTRLTIMREIANMWAVPISAVQTLYPVDKPVIQESRYDLRVGRVTLQRPNTEGSPEKKPFVELRNSLHVLERIACSVKSNEPVLLVGETGTGKTTLVQNLALRLGQRLTVLNLSQQSDVADLLGGFKPMNARYICTPLYEEFKSLFTITFSSKVNEDFLAIVTKSWKDKNWNTLFSGFQKGVEKVTGIRKPGSGSKRKRPLGEDLLKRWEFFSWKLKTARLHISSDGMIFSFVEGAFVKALRNGDWILLDEVNLAPPEIYQRVIGVLEEKSGSLCLSERGDIDYICRHDNFRIFACMNPATDAGKRDLPFPIRSRFTEYFIDDVLEDEDLILFVNRFIDDDHSNRELTSKVVRFYKAAKKESEERLQDGANQKPQYSLRSLYRALEYTKKARRTFGFQKALFDGFSMFFLTLLDEPSAKLMNQLILSHLIGGSAPPQVSFDRYLAVTDNSTCNDFVMKYVRTKSVEDQLRNLARAIFIGRYPVLLQGPTSSGKTSLVQYLAAITGHEFVRINNHEHTDLQEYLGSYITDSSGKLVFQEGVLVKAVRHGYWIVLDELNLAPSDVLEALNRLLDDNRELYLPELNEPIRAHPKFMLFATQNPPTVYGGRKMLSRAFRNRFVEIHVDEIPPDELSTILEKRCKISESYAKRMIKVMKDLQLHRQNSKVFAGRHGFITPRDLFRWADRYHTFGSSYEDLARDGYYLLAERLREDAEKVVVQEALEKELPIKINYGDMYKQDLAAGDTVMDLCNSSVASQNLGNIIWTRSMWRLYFLVRRCYQLREPVLLVGETGGGKTTVCQLLSIILGSKLHILNCHQYTETSDFLGGFYPVRERSAISLEFKCLCEQIMQSKAFIHFPTAATISSDINQASVTLDQVNVMINNYKLVMSSPQDVVREELDFLEKIQQDLIQLHRKWKTIFIWEDGPLVQAMKKGDLFLVDEISLADDSVLERLNSVLEPERKLSLPEKGGYDLEQVTAHPNFFLLATMNPGGDYGKKELSPALRNRFTEIWVPSVGDLNELKSIAVKKISNPDVSFLADLMINFWKWFNMLQTGRVLTVRDLLSWIEFINGTETSLPSEVAFLHGAFLVLLDGLTLGTSISKGEAKNLREKCLSFLLEQLKEKSPSLDLSNVASMEAYGWPDLVHSTGSSLTNSMKSDHLFGIHPFYIKKGDDLLEALGFEFDAPTTCRNAMRVLRAMQLSKPVLLEGSPGVGKTSLIVALGKFSGHTVVRINLSEQTDIMDLLGSDLPAECDEGIQFAWSDGILLQALKEGSWVLLDELNLAPQSVLEGLNAILDHRAEVFIPELGVTFKCPSSFRVFACQNPSYQGGGRKGLPKSFLNRFSKVYIDEPVEDDFLFICSSRYPSIPRPILSKLILFNKRLHEDTMLYHKFGQDGSPWEFNLRDVMRSCEIMEGAPESSKFDCFLNTVYVQRMRTSADRQEVIHLYEQVFGLKPFISLYPRVQLDAKYLVVGTNSIERNSLRPAGVSYSQLKILPEMRQSLEAVAQCVHHKWLVLLVGPASSGKTSLLRLLAQLTGNVLNELNLSSATDISELLGCFEQYNAFRNYRLAIAQVERYISEYCCLEMDSSTDASTRRKNLMKHWLAFLSSTDYCSSTSSVSEHPENLGMKSFGSISLLVEIVEQLGLELDKYESLGAWSFKDFQRTLKTIRQLQNDQMKRSYSAKFEWVTGLLLKAIENGEWIVLENANLCNPTVLDRINSLVEQSGSITVNECGNVDGKPVVLFPHPQFRMFLTVNPSYGEVSRAMRNRGVEICIMPPYWLLGEEFRNVCDKTELEDVKRFLVLSDIPGEKLVYSMAKAHICARDRGLQFGISISNLELTRWVQLFQRLLTNGNQPLWSLHISWEHTYLSSLGEIEGKDIVDHAIVSYLSAPQLYDIKFPQERYLCLPGGWPAPLMLRDFVWYSKEASVKQNCTYLEFLGSQGASDSFHMAIGRRPVELALSACGSPTTYLMDLTTLHALMYSKASHLSISDSAEPEKFDLTGLNKKLLFAANWAIEQATESDIELYLSWFSWFGAQLQPFCPFIPAFLTLLEQEMEHSIWKCIFHCRRVLMDDHMVNMALKRVPLLSPEIADSSGPVSKSCSEILVKAIHCVGLLRLSYQQWNSESEFGFSDKTRHLKPVLMSLRELEEKVLNLLVESPSFDVVFQLFSNLLEDHILFWKGVISSQSESLLISWRSLTKNVSKLREVCPREADKFHKESRNLDMVDSWSLRSQRSLLWVHGGHPFLPSSADIYQKQQQFEKLCDSIWRPKKLQELVVDGSPVEAAVSSNHELRFIAMQGVCMSTFIMSKVDEDDINVLQQLEEMYQMLLSKLSYEQQTLEGIMRTTEQASFSLDLTSCCVFSPDILCRRSGLSSLFDILPLSDVTSFYLDLWLLQELSVIVTIDEKDLQLALSSLSNRLESSLNFSLKFSSRPPTDFSPHQKIIWILGAWTSINAVATKISSCVHEMWFKWHSSLWTHPPVQAKIPFSDHCHDVILPDMLFRPVKTLTVDNILRKSCGIKDYSMHSLKLRVASRSIWQSSLHVFDSHTFLLSAARHLFQQIILVHRKSFDADKYSSMRSLFCSIQEKIMTEEDANTLISLVASSNHHVLRSSISLFIKPLLDELYLQSSSDSLYNLGCAWLHIGGLRYNLLICCDDLDPAMKYSFKYAQLKEKIASLELEIQVRDTCVHLAGSFPSRDSDKKRLMLLENLKAELKRMQKRIVFRSNPGKFKKLKFECNEFMKLVATSVGLIKNVEGMDIQQIKDQANNWQETATRFIERLSSEYSAYTDIIQPIQHAIYEMKLGILLVLSSALRKQLLARVGLDDLEIVLGTIYSFMSFPRGSATKPVSIMIDSRKAGLSFSDIEYPLDIVQVDLKLLESLVSSTRDADKDKVVSVLLLKASVHQNILLRVAYSAADAHFMDNSSFKLLDKIFHEFAILWTGMKDQVKTREEHDAQQYKFRPRAFKIENVIEMDISALGSLIENEVFSEWQELVSEEESSQRKEGDEEFKAQEEVWNALQDSVLCDVVNIHVRLFGSMDLVQNPGGVSVSDSERLCSFMDSYTLGTRVIKDLEDLSSSSLDDKLVPEHLLRLCLEREQKFISSPDSYNFYKSSNASVMSKMVEPVVALKQRIVFLLKEWDDHPALQKIVDVTEMILAIPLSTPLAKALSGLQFLLNRVRMLQETVSKFPLSCQLQPIFDLVSSWKKLELESWPALLDEVQARFDTNAGQLWFPLYSILQQRQSTDGGEYSQATVRSLEDFIQTSSIGEFRKRLQLLFAFHGQISSGIVRGSYLSANQEEIARILYNTFGFYVQFLPTVLEHLASNRRNIDKELNELLKLCRWDRSESYLTMEYSKRIRQKLKKLIQKYTDVLQQPVMLILNQEATRRGMQIHVEGSNRLTDTFERSRDILRVTCSQSQLQDNESPLWTATWKEKVNTTLQNVCPREIIESNSIYNSFAEVIKSIIDKCIASASSSEVYQEGRRQVWFTIDGISRNLIDCIELWKEEKKSLGKRRALSELLKLLDGCGLSKHRSTHLEDKQGTKISSRWFIQPSYAGQHLLLTEERVSSGDHDVGILEKLHSQPQPQESLETEWKTANEYFFKSIAAVGHLRQICLNFHKDFTLEQVNRSGSYLDHLLEIQQEQRAAAYGFAENLECLRRCILPLENLFLNSFPSSEMTIGTCSFSKNQNATFKCMWQQKQLFDSVCGMLHDECLLLKSVEKNHPTCPDVGQTANEIRLSIENFVPEFKKSKELLDKNLLGGGGHSVTASVLPTHYGITKQMELCVQQNFMLLKRFEEHLHAICKLDTGGGSVRDVLFRHFEGIFVKADMMARDLQSTLEAKNQSENIENSDHVGDDISGHETDFSAAVTRTCRHIRDAFCAFGSQDSGNFPSDESLGNISKWKDLFESRVGSLQLDILCNELTRTIQIAGDMLNHSNNRKPSLFLLIEAQLKHLYSLLDLILTFSNGLLYDFLVMHRMMSIITHVLANTFASLYSQGFGVPMEDQVEETKTQDATGTGMGEGAGLNDVSEQMNDEDQLLGTDEKPSDEQDASNDVPSKNDKGIEMEQDFAADTFSVSEDSGDDDNENDEDEQLDSAMGETGADSEVVDEKLWDKKDDNDKDSKTENEKYESGPSAKDNDNSGRELRAKEDAATTDEAGELDPVDQGKQNDDDDDDDDDDGNEGPDNMENFEDMNIDKEASCPEPSGLDLAEPTPGSDEDINMDETEGEDHMEDDAPEDHDELGEHNEGEGEKTNSLDENMDEAQTEQLAENPETENPDDNLEKNKNSEMMNLKNKDVFESVTSDFNVDRAPNAESATQPNGESQAAGMRNVAPEAQWSNSEHNQNDLTPMEGLPNASENEISVADSSKDGKLSENQSSQLPQLHSSSIQKSEPNPYRNVGDALDGWKERVKVSVDIQEKAEEATDEMVDENVKEYAFTTGSDKGTAQALGPAASEQINGNINGKEPNDEDGGTADINDETQMDIEEQHAQENIIKSYISSLGNLNDEQKEISEVGKTQDILPDVDNRRESDVMRQSESLVLLSKSHMNDELNQFHNLSVSDDEMGIAHNLEEVSGDTKDNASTLWRKYELLTTRLSQELTEQLRLVLEPTLASKLQGDYKTGKRINMKKVIPYIASHYRKDKIWLRRTRPNKRNYQVVIAVDDSRSMSESNCGEVAIEALVTVCRAMSQLEVGNLAVASFGKKGNIKLLHEFDQPFNGEAGVKMLSSFTFRQENTIADEPMVDLLKYLSNMMDAAVVNARLPSGENPLQQLVLILADGRFHEKEKLKRYVRDLLSKKRMVAFLLLDSPQESIMDLMEASFQGGNVSFSKYLDSFPFPYYIVLKNIEALPRTVADLLRQWFELMQSSRD